MSTMDEDGRRLAASLNQRTRCQLSDVDDVWDLDEVEWGDDVRDAVETVQQDHDEEVLVETADVWILKVYWNENTGSVWASAFGYWGGFEAMLEDGDPA